MGDVYDQHCAGRLLQSAHIVLLSLFLRLVYCGSAMAHLWQLVEHGRFVGGVSLKRYHNSQNVSVQVFPFLSLVDCFSFDDAQNSRACNNAGRIYVNRTCMNTSSINSWIDVNATRRRVNPSDEYFQ